MGVLETRNLDFDHLLLLSANEGNMPRGTTDSSFIPYSVRKAFGLTTVDHRVAIYSYYFHRLLSRATDITLVYNNATTDGQTGEMSRFMLQMLVESPHTIRQVTLKAGQKISQQQHMPIDKTPDVVDKLRQRFTVQQAQQQDIKGGISPSAINRYMRCQLQFYYCYVEGLREPEETDDDTIDNRIFGNIFHKAAQILYQQLIEQHGSTIPASTLQQLLRSKVEIELAVDAAFREELFHQKKPTTRPMELNGLQIINREVIVHYLRQLLEVDSRLAPFTILALEEPVQQQLPIKSLGITTTIGGLIDRLDVVTIEGQQLIRVVDYKTGSHRLRPLRDVDAIFGKAATVSLAVPAISDKGNYELAITAAKVNGTANEDANASATLPLIVLNTLPKKRALLEEYTGFWCGWCPRGYVGLEQLAIQYPDEYVLASYHNSDELEIMSSSYFPSQVDGFPSAWMDRAVSLDAYYGTGDEDFGIASDLALRNKLFGQADVTLTPVLSDDGKSVGITAEVLFPYAIEEGNYSVEYLLLADGLTDESWGQSNYYADGSNGYPKYMDTFSETSDGTVYGLPFNDVVVLTSEILGGSGNAVTSADADTPVSLSYTFDLIEAVNTSNEPVIQDTEKLKVAALLINYETGEVVNANKADVSLSTGIGLGHALSEGSGAVYDILGARRQKLQHGVNIIMRADGKARKVIVR